MLRKGWFEIIGQEVPKLRLALRALDCHSKYREKRAARAKIRKFHEGVARIAAALVPVPKSLRKIHKLAAAKAESLPDDMKPKGPAWEFGKFADRPAQRPKRKAVKHAS